MVKNKTILIFAVIFIFGFCSNNTSFAIQDTAIKYKCPDYAFEFVGKDRCENFNRKIFIFNSKINKIIIRPANTVWASIMPKYGMDRIKCAYTNMEFPIRFVSCLLEKDFKSSKTEALRFLTNTTIGFAGLYDPAKSKFKLEPRQEDMKQVLAYYNVKKGPYLVLPIVISGNVRDIVGEILNCPLNPTSYVIGPVAAAAKALVVLNQTASLQTIVKTIDSIYADPYDITKKLSGVEKYIYNSNLDRKEVLAKKISSQNIVKVSNLCPPCVLKSDIKIENYNSQGPLVDSMRTSLFDDKTLDDSIWSEMSVWNRCFSKKIKTSYVKLFSDRAKYKYRYILQKNKKSPLAIIYPSIGEGVMSRHSVVLAKIFYAEGYSVLIQGSAFQWEFVNSMPADYRPGFLPKDSYYSRILTSKIIDNLQKRYACNFGKRIIIGTSFGASTALFAAAQEEKENTLNISNYISINPPVEMLFALKQIDKYSQESNDNKSDIKERTALTAEKAIQLFQNISDKKAKISSEDKLESLNITDDEAKLVLDFIMKQKLSDLVFTVEKAPKHKKSQIYQTINNMNFYDYAQKYLLSDKYESVNQLDYDTSLHSIADFLKNSTNYKIYHTIDDYYSSPEQLKWLKQQSDKKTVLFSNGSHLGILYRKEFLDELKKDINLKNNNPPDKIPAKGL